MPIDRLIRNDKPGSYGPGRYKLAELVGHWLDINCWTHSDFALLTRSFCPQSRDLSSREIAAVLSGSRPELIPKHFQAFAAVERGIADINLAAASQEPPSDINLLSCFTSSISTDASGQNASWWFAVYCGEQWAIDKIDPDLQPKPTAITAPARELPQLLRSAISRNGLEPVAYIREAAQALHKRSSLQPSRYVDWALEYEILHEKEVRLAIPFSLFLLEAIGLRCNSIHSIKLQIEAATAIVETQLSGPEQVNPRKLLGLGHSITATPITS